MENKINEALRWIVGILDKHTIPYRIGGGLAAYVYGSSRLVKDIDITLPGKYFPLLIPEISEYVTSGPKYSVDEKWKGDFITVNFNGEEIDIADIDTLEMSDFEGSHWFKTKENFWKYDPIATNVKGVIISLIHPKDLLEYKKHLQGTHQIEDIKAIEIYIAGFSSPGDVPEERI